MSATDRAANRARRARNRDRALRQLGGQCVRCGSQDELQFDHVYPSTKSFVLASRMGCSWAVIAPELEKCQILCAPCHRKKTAEDGPPANKRTEIVHGTLTAYCQDRCRCEPCRARKSESTGSRNRAAWSPAEHGSVVMYSYHKCRCDICKAGQRDRMRAYRRAKAVSSSTELIPIGISAA